MVKWSDLSEASRASFASYDGIVDFDDRPWVTPPPPAERRLAVVTSAGLHRQDDKPFPWNDHGWRSFPREQRDVVGDAAAVWTGARRRKVTPVSNGWGFTHWAKVTLESNSSGLIPDSRNGSSNIINNPPL